ncbi:hypothetical protein [Actibacterium sp. XHP0104]|uniref:hypothetical protein n=1 Tax=Actibacterium sp. XHP0104 TaxID=2984335 RepID=UPI0021E97403|nr:hypothetical protein [Actibacterium sp. XHP0104]MCV2882307.1 hypothetical protein [Actibacterium sp. XHP0104]
MLGFIRLFIIVIVAQAILYVVVSVYSRSVRREKMEDSADEKIAQGDLDPGLRDAYIEGGMLDYEQSLRKKLIWGVIVLPMAAVLVLIYVTNFG